MRNTINSMLIIVTLIAVIGAVHVLVPTVSAAGTSSSARTSTRSTRSGGFDMKSMREAQYKSSSTKTDSAALQRYDGLVNGMSVKYPEDWTFNSYPTRDFVTEAVVFSHKERPQEHYIDIGYVDYGSAVSNEDLKTRIGAWEIPTNPILEAAYLMRELKQLSFEETTWKGHPAVREQWSGIAETFPVTVTALRIGIGNRVYFVREQMPTDSTDSPIFDLVAPTFAIRSDSATTTKSASLKTLTRLSSQKMKEESKASQSMQKKSASRTATSQKNTTMRQRLKVPASSSDAELQALLERKAALQKEIKEQRNIPGADTGPLEDELQKISKEIGLKQRALQKATSSK